MRSSESASFPRLPVTCRARRVDQIVRDKRVKPAVALVPNLLYRGSFTLLIAPDKTGKTTLVWSVVSGLSTAGTVLGTRVPRTRVLVVGLEEAPGDTKERVMNLGLAKATNVFLLADLHASGLTPFEVLQANVEAVQPDVIIIDTLSAYAAGQVADENSSMAWMAVLPQLSKLAHQREIALLVLHHTQKNGPLARGSGAITAQPDNLVSLSVAKNLPNHVRRMAWKGRQCGVGDGLIAYDAERRTYSPYAAQRVEAGADAKTANGRVRTSTTERVLQLITTRTHPLGAPHGELRKQVKGKAERVDAALKQLVADGTVVKTRDGRATRYALS